METILILLALLGPAPEPAALTQAEVAILAFERLNPMPYERENLGARNLSHRSFPTVGGDNPQPHTGDSGRGRRGGLATASPRIPLGGAPR